MMMKTLRTHTITLSTAAVIVAGLLIVSAAEAENNKASRGGVANTSQGTTTQGSGMKSDQTSSAFGTESNDNIAPAAGPVSSTSPRSNNTYGTTGKNLREDIKQGR